MRLILEKLCERVSTKVTLTVIKADPDDDRVLECPMEGRADIIVSGDRPLLALGSYDSIQILTVRQFLNQLTPAEWS